MGGFSDRTVTLEWDGADLSFVCDDEHLRAVAHAASSLTSSMPDAGNAEYSAINDTVHSLVSELFGEEARESIFGGRPESVIDSIEVLSAINRAANSYVSGRISAALAKHDPATIAMPDAI